MPFQLALGCAAGRIKGIPFSVINKNAVPAKLSDRDVEGVLRFAPRGDVASVTIVTVSTALDRNHCENLHVNFDFWPVYDKDYPFESAIREDDSVSIWGVRTIPKYGRVWVKTATWAVDWRGSFLAVPSGKNCYFATYQGVLHLGKSGQPKLSRVLSADRRVRAILTDSRTRRSYAVGDEFALPLNSVVAKELPMKGFKFQHGSMLEVVHSAARYWQAILPTQVATVRNPEESR